MKRVIGSIMSLLMLAVVSGFASGSDQRMVVVRMGEIFKVIYKSENMASVKVVISDLKGNKVFSEEILSIHGFIRPYNFSQLPKGDYTICLTDKLGKRTENIYYEEQTDGKAQSQWVPHVTRLMSDTRKVMVAIPYRGPADYTIRIYNHNDELVYQEQHDAEKDFAKVFNLSDFNQGALLHLTNNLTGETREYRAD